MRDGNHPKSVLVLIILHWDIYLEWTHRNTKQRYIQWQSKLRALESLLGMTADPFLDLAPISLVFIFLLYHNYLLFFSVAEHWHTALHECQWKMCVLCERGLTVGL